ncbi:MAG: hypothetical protein EP330_26785 [Deltaproteobacteria bacterium]|nr:MAG: hypothetical protein EP330_26785 [Deltaproteobacteria bacterium]
MSLRRAGFLLPLLCLVRTPAEAFQEPRRPNLILISLDTTRVDALSCYGRSFPGILRELGPITPHLDALAARGTRFEQAYAHAPTTLSSHASMLTGLDPHGHAIVRNGFPLPEGIRTLPERLADEGWDTIGIVAAAALESEMGLDRGFDTYDDDMNSKFGPMVQDRAERVVDRTFAALDAREGDAPLFLFTHFYDAHAPYAAPDESWKAFMDPAYTGLMTAVDYQIRPIKIALLDGSADPADLDAVASRYLAEVAYIDTQIGRLLEGLEQRGLLEHSIVVVTADHGEMMHEYPALSWSHGYDVFPQVTHVPLIVTGEGWPLPEGRVTQRQVGLAELAPTLEKLVGLEASLGTRRDFADMLALGPVRDDEGWPERPVHTLFAEATRSPKDHEKWNNLDLMRSVKAGGYELRAFPMRSMEPRLVAGERGIEPVLVGLLEKWDAKAPEHREEQMAEATREALEALGYLEE